MYLVQFYPLWWFIFLPAKLVVELLIIYIVNRKNEYRFDFDIEGTVIVVLLCIKNNEVFLILKVFNLNRKLFLKQILKTYFFIPVVF